jgi:endonuclease YncB( thermonuclease family)
VADFAQLYSVLYGVAELLSWFLCGKQLGTTYIQGRSACAVPASLHLIPSTCFSWPAKVVSVADGDTIIALHNGQQKEIRLYGIDCQEIGQRYGQQL